jgi:GntR family transcriptional regulator, transcriptional repressor for pyruvate dehydrogenase complex
MGNHATETTVRRPPTPVSGKVFSRLRKQILSGSLAPGEALPSERTLVDDLGVSRHAVREALRRLQQAGLIAVSHGGATRVLDLRSNGGLDLLPHLALQSHGRIDPTVLRAALEMRVSIGADAARLCAMRATPSLCDQLRETVDAMKETDDLAALADLNTQFWGMVVDGADNIAYRLAFNSLIRCLRANEEPALRLISVELLDRRRRLLLEEAIAEGNEHAAELCAREALSGGLEVLLDYLSRKA